MEPNTAVNLPVIDQKMLTGVVRSMHSNETLEIEKWQITQVGGGIGNPVSVGIYRVQGGAHGDGGEKAWSAILKILQSPENVGLDDMGGGDDGSHWNYWKREPLVYQSSILESLPEGLVAPKCYAVEELPGNVARLWLEDIQDMYNGAWTLQRYSLTARQLGRLNGMHLSKSSYPEYPWLGREINQQWLHDLFSNPLPWNHPLALSRYPEPDTNPFIRLVLQHDRFLEKLNSLPRTLSHGDAYPTNFLSRIDLNGKEQTVALDWALLGLQPLGYDLGQFVFGAINNLKDTETEEIIDTIFEAYLDGLRDEGSEVDVELVRYSFAVSAALRVGLFELFMLAQAIEEGHAETSLDKSCKIPDPFEVLMARKAFRLLEG